MPSSLLDKFKQGFGIRKPQELNLGKDPYRNLTGTLTKFTDAELVTLIHRHALNQNSANARQHGILDILNYLRPGHERSVQVVQDAERAKALIPEISRAEQILISSIMSPNDLQDADPIYEIEDMPQLQEDMVANICKYLKTVFSTNYNLGEKLTEWTREALFRSGAAVILTLPESVLTKMVKDYRDNKRLTSGYEGLSFQDVKSMYSEVFNKSVYSHESSTPYQKKDDNKFSSVYKKEYKAGVEHLYFARHPLLEDDETKQNEKYSAISSSLEAMTATIVTKFEEGDIIKVSENPEVLRFGKAVRNYQKTKLGKEFDQLWAEENKRRNSVSVSGGVDRELVLDISEHLNETDQTEGKSMPFNIELPAESVIPICIPGSRKNKLGYFVLVDAYGHPIKASQYITTGGGCTNSARIANAYSTMFGQTPTPGGIQSPASAFQLRPGTQFDPSETAINQVFNYVLDTMLKKKLNDIGLSDIEFGEYETIATCMFYRLLENKETALVFVPESLITYVAFNFRDDGTGKNLLEDGTFILSLICVLLVANIMGAMKNAVAKQELTVEFNEDEINPDQVIEQIKNIAIQKGQINFTYNPSDIARTITDQAISIKAINHPNSSNFNIERTYKSDDMPKMDSDMMDTLMSQLTTLFGIPHSAVNQLDDAEYAKSIATSNLFFAQLVRSYQKTISKAGSDHVKLNIKYSPTIREGLLKIINNHITYSRDELNPENHSVPNDGGKDIKGVNLEAEKLLKEIVEHIKISLPAPNIAPNKAQYEVVREFTDILTGIMDNLYPTDMVKNQDEGASDGLAVLKAFIRSSMTKKLLAHLGLDTGLEVQDLQDFIVENREGIVGILRTARNFNQDITLDQQAQTTETEQEDTGDAFGGTNNDTFGEGTDEGEETNPFEDGTSEGINEGEDNAGAQTTFEDEESGGENEPGGTNTEFEANPIE